MDAFTVNANVNEQHLLSAQVPESIQPGPVKIVILPATDEGSEQAWMDGVARQWADELGDSRQDIYTLDDGAPVDAG
ncbi:MAG TPA: hypothetical protein VGI75_01275 [Pirellulales bacterium]|jgi:hypothetical protein